MILGARGIPKGASFGKNDRTTRTIRASPEQKQLHFAENSRLLQDLPKGERCDQQYIYRYQNPLTCPIEKQKNKRPNRSGKTPVIYGGYFFMLIFHLWQKNETANPSQSGDSRTTRVSSPDRPKPRMSGNTIIRPSHSIISCSSIPDPS